MQLFTGQSTRFRFASEGPYGPYKTLQESAETGAFPALLPTSLARWFLSPADFYVSQPQTCTSFATVSVACAPTKTECVYSPPATLATPEQQQQQQQQEQQQQRRAKQIRNVECTHCKTTSSPMWRRTLDKKKYLCNACGLYIRKHGGTSRQLHDPSLATNNTNSSSKGEFMFLSPIRSPECERLLVGSEALWMTRKPTRKSKKSGSNNSSTLSSSKKSGLLYVNAPKTPRTTQQLTQRAMKTQFFSSKTQNAETQAMNEFLPLIKIPPTHQQLQLLATSTYLPLQEQQQRHMFDRMAGVFQQQENCFSSRIFTSSSSVLLTPLSSPKSSHFSNSNHSNARFLSPPFPQPLPPLPPVAIIPATAIPADIVATHSNDELFDLENLISFFDTSSRGSNSNVCGSNGMSEMNLMADLGF
ncbi:hypothetical protein HK100_000790 [Physocladia obscura]|uniref:GATA-type domain-containing protein n=1 Tax=Physocladia obscura TaxID=109957 RepID=A0AAD5XKB6_9FUNG|nr:hypothetical protein HK100_000790 [Physocladia obscura]